MARKGTGVEVRDASIRIKFALDGKMYAERLTTPEGDPLAPTAGNIRAAENTARAVRDDIRLGVFSWATHFPASKHARAEAGQQADDSLGALLDMWVASKLDKTAGSVDQYITAARVWKRIFGAEIKVKALTHKRLAAAVGSLTDISAKTKNNYLIALRGAFALEYPGPQAIHNPMNGITNGDVVKKPPDPFTVEERDTILPDLAKHYDERIYAYFLWAFYTGMRPQEIIALRWSDVDWHNESIRVQRVRTFRGTEREGSKTHTVRDVDLLPQALQALAIMKPHTFMKRIQRPGDPDDSCDIFERPEYLGGKHGGMPYPASPWHDERIQRDDYWKPSLKRVKVRWRRPYNTRHTYATVALMTGTPPAYIAAQLGHSVKMLLERYAKWIPGNDAGSAKKKLRETMGKKAA